MKIYIFRFTLVLWFFLGAVYFLWILKVLIDRDSNSISYLFFLIPMAIVMGGISFILTGMINPKAIKKHLDENKF